MWNWSLANQMPVLFLNPNRSKHFNMAILGFYCKFDSRIEFDKIEFLRNLQNLIWIHHLKLYYSWIKLTIIVGDSRVLLEYGNKNGIWFAEINFTLFYDCFFSAETVYCIYEFSKLNAFHFSSLHISCSECENFTTTYCRENWKAIYDT